MATTTTASPTVVIIVGVIALVVITTVIVMAIRRREETFEGEVIDKNIVENVNNMPMNSMNTINNGGINIGNGGVQHQYYVKVKTTSGKTVGYKISSGMYERVQIGDMVRKPKGTTEITITSSKSISQVPANNQTPPTGIS